MFKIRNSEAVEQCRGWRAQQARHAHMRLGTATLETAVRISDLERLVYSFSISWLPTGNTAAPAPLLVVRPLPSTKHTWPAQVALQVVRATHNRRMSVHDQACMAPLGAGVLRDCACLHYRMHPPAAAQHTGGAAATRREESSCLRCPGRSLPVPRARAKGMPAGGSRAGLTMSQKAGQKPEM